MLAYTTELSMPLVGLAANEVVAEVRRALADDTQIERLEHRPPWTAGRPDEHVAVVVQFRAPSPQAARQLAADLHERALRGVLAAAPADRGWTSGYAPPEPVLA